MVNDKSAKSSKANKTTQTRPVKVTGRPRLIVVTSLLHHHLELPPDSNQDVPHPVEETEQGMGHTHPL